MLSMVAVMMSLFTLQGQAYQYTIQRVLARQMALHYHQMTPTCINTIYHIRILTHTNNMGVMTKAIDQALTM